MRIKEISVTCKRLIALPRYENVTYECSATAEVDPQDDPDEVYEETLEFCKNKIAKELARFEDVSSVQKQKKRID